MGQKRDKHHKEVYLKYYKYIPQNYSIHHIDRNRKNDSHTNLIALPDNASKLGSALRSKR